MLTGDTGKTLFQTAPAQKHNVSLEGASGKSTYRVSFGYDSKDGLMRYNPENFNVTMQAQISRQRFSLGLKLAPALIFAARIFLARLAA